MKRGRERGRGIERRGEGEEKRRGEGGEEGREEMGRGGRKGEVQGKACICMYVWKLSHHVLVHVHDCVYTSTIQCVLKGMTYLDQQQGTRPQVNKYHQTAADHVDRNNQPYMCHRVVD